MGDVPPKVALIELINDFDLPSPLPALSGVILHQSQPNLVLIGRDVPWDKISLEFIYGRHSMGDVAH